MKKFILALAAGSALLFTAGCLDNARSAVVAYCNGANAVLAEYGNWSDLVPANYQRDVARAASSSAKLCANPSTLTPRQAYDIAADLYRSLEIARKYAPQTAAWQGSVERFDVLMSRAREAGLK